LQPDIARGLGKNLATGLAGAVQDPDDYQGTNKSTQALLDKAATWRP
jgi:hypothetical protein